MVILFILLGVLLLVGFVLFLRRRQLLKLFDDGNVIVTGLRGRGKDLLFSFVTNHHVRQSIKSKSGRYRRKYISNIDYTSGKGYIPFRSDSMLLGGNTFHNFVVGKFNFYSYPYKDGFDYFISDGGVYFPAQYFQMLDKYYPSAPLFFALSRHLGNCNIHFNVQNLNRLWDKIREQADIYILCRSCKVLFGRIAIQKITVYDRYESCIDRRRPFARFAFRGKEVRMRQAEFDAQYGIIKNMTIVHVLPKKHYNDRIFKDYLLKGVSNA